ncbi:MAG: cupin domain-containing protein [Candidatus Helarchaeota archaeon]
MIKMAKIEVKKPTKEEIEEAKNWGIWEKEPSEFDWYYDTPESCYILEGEVTVKTEDGDEVTIKAGDLVHFPQGLKCVWNVKKKIRKHFTFK